MSRLLFRSVSFIGAQPCPFTYLLSMTPFHAIVADWTVVTVWPANPKIFTMWPFTEGVCLSVLELQVSVKQRR